MKADSKTTRPIPSPIAKPESESAAPPPSPSPASALTRVDAELAGLPPRQRTALMALANGRGFGDAARLAGVTRQTLRNWRKKDLRFSTLVNIWQNEIFISAQHRLIGLAEEVVTTLADAITSGDARVALQVAHRLGLLAPFKPGPEDPDELRREQLLVQREQQAAQDCRDQGLRQQTLLAKLLKQ